MANTAASVLITNTLDQLARAGASTTRSGETLTNVGITWLNWTMYNISKKHDFKEMKKLYTRSTVSGTKGYTLPENWKKIVSLRVIDGSSSQKLVRLTERKVDKYRPYPAGDETDRPVWYYPYNNYVDLIPIPDGAYELQLRVIVYPTVITSTTDTIDYEPDKDELIVAGMTYRAFRHFQMYEDASFWKSEFKDMLKDAIDTDEDPIDWEPYAEGFSAVNTEYNIGEYWNKPFVFGNL